MIKLNWWIIGIIFLVTILVIYLIYSYRNNASASNNINDKDSTSSSKFPLKVGTYNSKEVQKLQSYLNIKGITDCDNKKLLEDGDFGSRTECAVKKLFNTTQVTEQMYKNLGI